MNNLVLLVALVAGVAGLFHLFCIANFSRYQKMPKHLGVLLCLATTSAFCVVYQALFSDQTELLVASICLNFFLILFALALWLNGARVSKCMEGEK